MATVDPDKRRQHGATYYRRHREALLAKAAAYRAAHRAELVEGNRQYRARKRAERAQATTEGKTTND